MRDELTKARGRRRFGRWARTYEHDRRSRFNAIPQQRAVAALMLRPGDRFLDVGCGTGAAVTAHRQPSANPDSSQPS